MTAWTLVAIGAATEINGGNLSITVPAGGQKGDLYIAVIAYRDTPAFTAPTGWTIHAQESLGNTATSTASSIASGLIASTVRGDTAPTNTFTRTLGNVALGRILIYRPNNGRPVFWAATSQTAAANTVTPSCPTIDVPSSIAYSLIIEAFCGADNITVQSMGSNALGSLATTTDTTNPPTISVWRERVDAGTNLGSDTSVAIADCVLRGGGGTGSFSGLASASSRHVVIGAAFYVKRRYVLAT